MTRATVSPITRLGSLVSSGVARLRGAAPSRIPGGMRTAQVASAVTAVVVLGSVFGGSGSEHPTAGQRLSAHQVPTTREIPTAYELPAYETPRDTDSRDAEPAPRDAEPESRADASRSRDTRSGPRDTDDAPRERESTARDSGSTSRDSGSSSRGSGSTAREAEPRAAEPAPSPESRERATAEPVTDPIDAWINDATKVLKRHGYTDEQIDRHAIRTIIENESGGNPNAVNNWDSNATAGTPSQGLMQTIDPTFDSYALPGHDDILNPVDNIIAGTRYSIDRYGSMANVPGVSGMRSGGSYVGY